MTGISTNRSDTSLINAPARADELNLLISDHKSRILFNFGLDFLKVFLLTGNEDYMNRIISLHCNKNGLDEGQRLVDLTIKGIPDLRGLSAADDED